LAFLLEERLARFILIFVFSLIKLENCFGKSSSSHRLTMFLQDPIRLRLVTYLMIDILGIIILFSLRLVVSVILGVLYPCNLVRKPGLLLYSHLAPLDTQFIS
jgi:hypothetical protein